MQAGVGPDRPLRSALTTFVGPVSPGEVFVETDCLRAGSSLTFMEAHVRQDEVTRTHVTAGFGKSRPTRLDVEAAPRPEAPAPDTIEPMSYLPGIVPAFLQHFDLRWIAPLPYSGADRGQVHGWIRPRDDRNVDAAGVLSLVDAWPPPEITRAEGPFPLSSVTWIINLVADLPHEGTAPDDWWFYDSVTTAAKSGYTDCVGRLWAPDGRLAATSRQLVAEFSGTQPEG
jgi:acyl-CoA thioesterase